jgi:hypothetical protein
MYRIEIDLPEVLADVAAAFETYERALVENDTATLNKLFWNDPRVLRLGVAENLFGHEAIAAFRAARPAGAAARTITAVRITSFGRECAHTCVEFERNGQRGRQTQTWLRLPEGWRIVAAHVSQIPA